jgi:predicted permease
MEPVNQIALFYLLILIGYLIARLSGKGKPFNHYLTALLIRLLVPLLVIYSLVTTSGEVIAEFPSIVLLAVLIHLLGLGVMYVRLMRSGIDNATKGVLYLSATFGNALFIPLPLVVMFIGESGIPFVIVFSITQLVLLATLGSFIGFVSSKRNIRWKDLAKRVLAFPPLLAAVLAATLALMDFTLPDPLAAMLSYSGALTSHLALVSVGLGVGTGFSFNHVRSSLEVVAVRQVIVPIMVAPILLLSSLQPTAFEILFLEALMPTAVLVVPYASAFGLDTERTATIVTLGTLLLIPVLPFLAVLLG